LLGNACRRASGSNAAMPDLRLPLRHGARYQKRGVTENQAISATGAAGR
jgi:hypothetical protein